jgi:hypothetical protein
MMGIEFKDISIEKVSDLGDGGASLHMVMDMSGLMEGLGDLGGEGMGAFESGIAFDAYVFRSGDDVLMLVTMWPAGEASPVDAQALAEAMDARAQ